MTKHTTKQDRQRAAPIEEQPGLVGNPPPGALLADHLHLSPLDAFLAQEPVTAFDKFVYPYMAACRERLRGTRYDPDPAGRPPIRSDETT
jgi:hypothetical protein